MVVPILHILRVCGNRVQFCSIYDFLFAFAFQLLSTFVSSWNHSLGALTEGLDDTRDIQGWNLKYSKVWGKELQSWNGWDGTAGIPKPLGPVSKNRIQRASWGNKNWEQESQRKDDLLLIPDICVISSYSKQLSTTQHKTISQVVPDNMALTNFTGNDQAAAGGGTSCSSTCYTPTLPPSALLALSLCEGHSLQMGGWFGRAVQKPSSSLLGMLHCHLETPSRGPSNS